MDVCYCGGSIWGACHFENKNASLLWPWAAIFCHRRMNKHVRGLFLLVKPSKLSTLSLCQSWFRSKLWQFSSVLSFVFLSSFLRRSRGIFHTTGGLAFRTHEAEAALFWNTPAHGAQTLQGLSNLKDFGARTHTGRPVTVCTHFVIKKRCCPG